MFRMHLEFSNTEEHYQLDRIVIKFSSKNSVGKLCIVLVMESFHIEASTRQQDLFSASWVSTPTLSICS